MFTTRTLCCCTLTTKTACSTSCRQCSVRAACRLFVYHANSVLLHTLNSKTTCSANQLTMLCENSLSLVCLPRELCAAAHSAPAKQLAPQPADDAVGAACRVCATRTLRSCTLTKRKTTCSTDSGQCSVKAACRLFVDHANSVIWTHSRTAKNLLHNQRTMLCESRLSVVCLPRELCAAAHSPYAKQHAVQTADNALSEQLVGCLSTTRTLRCWTHSPAKQLAPHPADNAL